MPRTKKRLVNFKSNSCRHVGLFNNVVMSGVKRFIVSAKWACSFQPAAGHPLHFQNKHPALEQRLHVVFHTLYIEIRKVLHNYDLITSFISSLLDSCVHIWHDMVQPYLVYFACSLFHSVKHWSNQLNGHIYIYSYILSLPHSKPCHILYLLRVGGSGDTWRQEAALSAAPSIPPGAVLAAMMWLGHTASDSLDILQSFLSLCNHLKHFWFI